MSEHTAYARRFRPRQLGLEELRYVAPRAREAQQIIEGGYQAPAGTFGTLEKPTIGAIGEKLKGGFSAARYAQARRRVTKGFASQAGRYAGAGARRGFVSPGDVSQAISGAPSAGLARGLGDLQVAREREQQRNVSEGLRYAQGFREEIGRGREGYGALVGGGLQALRRSQGPYGLTRAGGSFGGYGRATDRPQRRVRRPGYDVTGQYT